MPAATSRLRCCHHRVMNKWRGRFVLLIAALGMVAAAPPVSGAAERPCNGSVELCGRTLDQVVLPGTHNSMNAVEPNPNGANWLLPNQLYSIPNQLERGARVFLIDTYYGERQPNGSVVAMSKSAGEAAGAETFMCHALCQLGFVGLSGELGRIKDYLEANPRQVVVFVNEDYIAPQDFAKAVDESGLLPYVYQGPATQYPTLGEMINTNQRVVMLAQSDTGTVPWYHVGYDGPMMETPYEFDDPAELTDPAQLEASCAPNRGSEGSPFFLMNHWVLNNNVPEQPSAEVVNTQPAIVDRARACEQRRGKLPNLLAVDFYGIGDAAGAARELNGVTAGPYLELTAPKAATVKSKRKATYRIPLSNFGDLEASGILVCAKVPAALARKPKCVSVGAIATNGSATAKVSVTTRKRYRKGSGRVKFSVYSNQATLSTSAKLTVKPLKKPKRHRKA